MACFHSEEKKVISKSKANLFLQLFVCLIAGLFVL